MNIFVLNTLPPDVSTGAIFRRVTPFWIIDMVGLTLLVPFPAISLFLANLANSMR